MPVRKIPRSYTSLTGIFIPLPRTRGIAFESSLERDFLILTCFDHDCHGVEEQPVRIPHIGWKGRTASYVPDFLVTRLSRDRAELIEVKPSKFLKKDRIKLKPKFAAAREFAGARGWDFRVLTERDIRTVRLENARKLMPYRRHPGNEEARNRIIEVLPANGPMTVSSIIESIWHDHSARAEGLYCLWHMLSTFQVEADLDRPLTMKSVISLPGRN